MLKKMVTIGALIAGLTLLLAVLGWLISPQTPSMLGPGAHFNSNTWNSTSTSWVLFSWLTRLMIWGTPVLLIAWLVSSLFQPLARKSADPSFSGGES